MAHRKRKKHRKQHRHTRGLAMMLIACAVPAATATTIVIAVDRPCLMWCDNSVGGSGASTRQRSTRAHNSSLPDVSVRLRATDTVRLRFRTSKRVRVRVTCTGPGATSMTLTMTAANRVLSGRPIAITCRAGEEKGRTS
jgi:hypothetical protein